MTGLLLATAILARAPVLDAALVIGSVHEPVLTGIVVLGIVAASAFRTAKDQQVDPAVGRIVSVAGDLRAGKPLRTVLASGVLGDQLASIAESGRPIRVPPNELTAAFGPDARLVQATLELATDGGGPVADAFDRLAAGMIESERTRRERRAALAPVVAQAVIVGGVPTALLAGMLVDGRWLVLVSAGPTSAAIVLFGTVSLVAGIVWTMVLVGRGRRP
jgi:hypothetical protein